MITSCLNCGRGFGELEIGTFCSDECEEKFAQSLKEEQEFLHLEELARLADQAHALALCGRIKEAREVVANLPEFLRRARVELGMNPE